MPDEITTVAYYVGSIPHKVGEGAKILNAVKDAGVNLCGFLGYPKGRKAEIILIVDEKAPNLAPIAKKAGVELGKKQKALFVTGEDRPGAGAELLGKIAAAGINVETIHAVCAGAGRYGALITVAPAALKKAAKALGA